MEPARWIQETTCSCFDSQTVYVSPLREGWEGLEGVMVLEEAVDTQEVTEDTEETEEVRCGVTESVDCDGCGGCSVGKIARFSATFNPSIFRFLMSSTSFSWNQMSVWIKVVQVRYGYAQLFCGEKSQQKGNKSYKKEI